MPLTRVRTGGITDANITTAKVADAAIATAKIADDAVTTAKVEAGLNNTVLLDTHTDASAVDYGGDVVIHNWGSHVGTYKKFKILTRCVNVGNGNFHMYGTYRMANSNAPMVSGRLHGHGIGSTNRGLFDGTGQWIRIGYRVPTNHPIVTEQIISNDDFGLTTNEELTTISYTSTWHQDNSGFSYNAGSVEVTSQTSDVAQFLLNSDPADTGAGSDNLWRVKSYLWGIV